MSAADELVGSLPRVTLVVGKGGVGKTTCASALAIRSASRFGRTLLLSTDPAKALGSVLGSSLGALPMPIGYAPMLSAQQLDAAAERSRFMAKWGGVLRLILDRGTYLDEADINPMVDTALPGSDEIFSALALSDLIGDSSWQRLVVDTAPTGHTLRLLTLPRTFRALVNLLEAMQAKHRFMVRTLTRAYRSDDADAFLAEMEQRVSRLESALRDPEQCTAVVVTNPQSLVVEETRRLLEALSGLHIPVAAIVWNATAAGENTPALDTDAGQYRVSRLPEWPTGSDGLRTWLDDLDTVARRGSKRPAGKRRARATKREARRTTTRPGARIRPTELLRSLTIVAGKGGVGKTTIASALALDAAAGGRTLAVSTDPAPSLADAFGQSIPDSDTAVQGVPGLFARQMDATAAFARLRDEYQARVDALFAGLVARGVDLAHDRMIARDLLALAPPGIDEVYALSLIADALFEEKYATVVVDPAPTGHLVRLLEMPALALSWSHQLLRLMLRYKDVPGMGAGETAQDLLDFSRDMRGVQALLRDETRCAVVLVTLDEPVVRAESERLAHEIRGRGISISGIVENRSSSPSLPAGVAPVHFQAPMTNPPPMGVASLRDWLDKWEAFRS